MKKTLITLAALAAASVASAATTPKWGITAGPSEGLVTYTTSLTGLYDIALGDAAITKGETFILEVKTTLNSHNNDWGTGIISTGNAYGGSSGADNFTVYLGNAAKEHGKVELSMNNWTYGGANASIPTTTPLTLAFTLAYDGSKFTFAPTADSQVTWDAITDTNVVTTYNFAALNNLGNNNGTVFDKQMTTISITKAGTLPVPEPTTATLSLLALAGLAARRRRK